MISEGEFKTIDVSASILVSDLKPVIELELSIPANNQKIIFENVELTDTSKTLSHYNIKQDDILLVLGEITRAPPSNGQQGQQGQPTNPEQLRQQILNDPNLVRSLQAVLNY